MSRADSNALRQRLLAACEAGVPPRAGFVTQVQIGEGTPSHCCAAGGLGAPDAPTAAVEDVGVDHGGAYVALAEQLLNGADIVAVLQKMGGEGVPDGVADRGPGDARATGGRTHRLLRHGFVQVMPPHLAVSHATYRRAAGKTNCQPQLVAALEYLRSSALGTATLPKPRARSRR